MKTLETLKAARAKIADERRWTQNTSARDSQGEMVPPMFDRAEKWCAVGAIVAVDSEDRMAIKLLDRLSGERQLGSEPRPAAKFNDSHTHAEVLALFDKAIASLEAA